jgi:hypothetical protein
MNIDLFSASCKATFGQVETAACDCIEEKRKKINGIIVSAADKIKVVCSELSIILSNIYFHIRSSVKQLPEQVTYAQNQKLMKH